MSFTYNRFLSLVFVSVLPIASCKSEDKEVIETWDNGRSKVELVYTNRNDSSYTRYEYYEDGKLRSSQQFEHNKLNGKAMNYSDNGVKEKEFDYVNGEKTG